MKISSKDGSKVMTVIASPGQGPDRSTEVSYTDTKVGSRALSLLSTTFVSLSRSLAMAALVWCTRPSSATRGRWWPSRKFSRTKGQCQPSGVIVINILLFRFKNRELQIMRRLDHCNIVSLLYFFYTSGEKKDEIYLNLVLEYIPETVYKVARQYSKQKQTIPVTFIKLYMYQLFRLVP